MTTFRFPFFAAFSAIVLSVAAFCRGDDLAPAPENLISPAHAIDAGHVPAPWANIVAQLQKKGNIEAAFTENRYLPFKKAPVVFTGEIRISAEHGMSLHYRTPEDRRMIIDSQGVLLRDAAGHSRKGPSDSHALAATTAMLDVMRFDFKALATSFTTYAAGDAKLWHFGFEPKDDDVKRALTKITVTGENDDVRRIVIQKSARSSIEVMIGEVKTGVTFSPEDLQRYFR